MKTLLILEKLGLVGLSIFLFARLDFNWWWYPLLFFGPDLSMLAYTAGPRTGAAVYNLVHHQGAAVLLYLLGFFLFIPVLQLAGAVMLGHSVLDRLFGYGLKYSDSFNHTHLGTIGGGSSP
jgi:hypothetical protein